MDTHGGGSDKNNGTEPGESADADLHEMSLSLDAILSLLAHHQRRDLIHCLVESPDRTTNIEECVDYLLKREEEQTGKRPNRDQMETILHHVHIPKLEDAGILEYDPRSQELRYWGHDRLESWLNRIQADEAEFG